MNCFIFIGPPGAGKGTQSALLQERLGFTHVSTGTLIRKEIESQSDLGKSVKNIVESGNYVDDQTIVRCLENHLKTLYPSEINLQQGTKSAVYLTRSDTQAMSKETATSFPMGIDENEKKVVLLDGIPRNIHQAEILDELFGKHICGVIALTADLEELVERLAKRWQCTNCGRIESFDLPPSSEYACPSCNAAGCFSRRKDDDPAIIRSRFKIYTEQTATLIEFYKARKMLYEFDALQSVEIMYVHLASLILQKSHRMY